MRRLLWLTFSVTSAALFSLLTLISDVHAQGYYPYQNYYSFTQPNCYPYYGSPPPNYQPPPYYQQKVYPAQKVIAQEIAVAPLIVTVPVDSKAVPVHAFGNPYYYSVSEAYREKAYLRDVLREELRSLLSTGGVSASTTYSGRPASAPADPRTAPERPKEVVAVPDTTTPPELQKRVLAAYQGKANCVSCHDKASAKIRLVLGDGKGNYQLVKQNSDKRWKIYGMASVGAMPPAAATDAAKAMETAFLPDMLRYAAQKD
jgi:hypothetical protein